MTRMIPDVIHPDVRSSAERRVFQWLKSAPGTDDWVCLHSLGLAKHETQRAGEIDFLLVTRHAVLVLEVKGGRVNRGNGEWRHVNRFDQVNSTRRSPFEQVRNAMFSLERRVRDRFDRGSRLANLLMGYGVVTPDCALRSDVDDHEGTESSESVIDCDCMPKGAIWCIGQLTTFNREQQTRKKFEPRKSDAEELVEFLRGDFDAVVPLSATARSTLERMQALEPAQYAILDMLRDEPRLLVTGSAGTGKTVLAREAARRAAWHGQRVLMLCFNRFLADHLRSQVKDDRVTVKTIFSFARGLIEQSDQRTEFSKSENRASASDLWDKLIPEHAPLAAIERSEDAFDVIIVDEAQDLLMQWVLDVIDAVLVGGLSGGTWRIFLDSNNQAAVYGRYDESVAASLQRIACRQALYLNVRNTREIAEESYMVARPSVRAESRVDGSSVIYEWYDTSDEQAEIVESILERLIARDRIDPATVTVLSPFKSPTWLNSYSGSRPLTLLAENNAQLQPSGITYATVSAFKGLENDVIILTDIDALESDRDRAIAYVGMTRARIQLFVLLPTELEPEYRMLVREWLEDEEENLRG